MLARFHRGDDGANAVEFALLLPVFIILLFGTMYGAAMFNTQQTLTLAAREGARYGATLPVSHSATLADWAAEVADRTIDLATTDRPLIAGTVSVCVRLHDEGGNELLIPPYEQGEAGFCPDDSVGPAQAPRVEVTVSRPSRIDMAVATTPEVRLNATATARYEVGDL